MTARRAITLAAQSAICVVAFAATAYAQSGGDEPSLEQRLRGHLLKMPDQTRDITPPTEVERSQEEARRSREGTRRSQEQGARSPNDPTYVGPLSTDTSTGRMGAAGWTSPPLDSFGRATNPEMRSGSAGFGFAVEWGGPRRGAEAP